MTFVLRLLPMPRLLLRGWWILVTRSSQMALTVTLSTWIWRRVPEHCLEVKESSFWRRLEYPATRTLSQETSPRSTHQASASELQLSPPGNNAAVEKQFVIVISEAWRLKTWSQLFILYTDHCSWELRSNHQVDLSWWTSRKRVPMQSGHQRLTIWRRKLNASPRNSCFLVSEFFK